MFSYLQEYKRIFVTGPHRSGTRICTWMISNDTGYQYVDEQQTWHSWESVRAFTGPCVFHCPLLMQSLHHHVTVDDVIVVMHRSPLNSGISARRIGITKEAEELERQVWTNVLKLPAGDPSESLQMFKYRVWDTVLRPLIFCRVVNVEYESLRSHPLWVEDRPNWRWSQIR